MKVRIPLLLALLLLACDAPSEPEPDQLAERSPAPAPDREPVCELGSLGCRCPDDGVCWAGYRCSYALGSATVCGLETFGDPASCVEHKLELPGPAVTNTGACVASCTADSDCGSLSCVAAEDASICAWP